ncbi:hypothetical protein GFS31_14470 [Leptolyngbya sp. BL0902]|nr:hypothetical protein GFS31_14470 [Leptolyngbya sp. BL0902]
MLAKVAVGSPYALGTRHAHAKNRLTTVATWGANGGITMDFLKGCLRRRQPAWGLCPLRQ